MALKELFRPQRMWRRRGELKDRYDVVIVGGGSHGLATAYYLAKNHGITNVAILEKGYIGSGAAGRNTTIIRANYRTPQGAEFYKQSLKLYEGLGAELDFNLLFSQQGYLTLAHSDRAMIVMTERADRIGRNRGRPLRPTVADHATEVSVGRIAGVSGPRCERLIAGRVREETADQSRDNDARRSHRGPFAEIV